MFLSLFLKKSFVAGRIVHGDLLRLTWKDAGCLCYYDFCHFFTEQVVIKKGGEMLHKMYRY